MPQEPSNKEGRLLRILKQLGKGKFKEAKKDINDSIYDNVVKPAADKGEDTGLRSALGAGLSATSDLLIPDDGMDVAMMAIPPAKFLKKGVKAAKALKRLDQAEEVAEDVAKVAKKVKVKSGVAKEIDALTQERRQLMREDIARKSLTPEKKARLKELEDMISEKSPTLDYRNLK